MGDTAYARQIKAVAGPSGETIERIFVKQYQQEEIRLSWWPGGSFVPRPLDVTGDELLPLLSQAIAGGVFTDRFLKDLQTILSNQLGDDI